MKTTREIDITVRITVEIDTDELDYGVSGGAKGENAVNEAVHYVTDEAETWIEDSVHIYENGITLLKTEIV
jgi:hypothetical protein